MGRPPSHDELPDAIVRFLTGGQATVVSTVGPDGRPDTTLMTWVVARDAERLALCVDSRSRTFDNLSARPEIALEVLGDGITVGVRGHARIEKERLVSAPFPCALVVVTVDEVRDHSAPGTRFYGPRYAYEDDKLHRHDFERRIFEELRTG